MGRKNPLLFSDFSRYPHFGTHQSQTEHCLLTATEMNKLCPKNSWKLMGCKVCVCINKHQGCSFSLLMHHFKVRIYIKLVSNCLRIEAWPCQLFVSKCKVRRTEVFFLSSHLRMLPNPLARLKPPVYRTVPCNSAALVVHITVLSCSVSCLIFLSA